jgi:hypothetical protein
MSKVILLGGPHHGTQFPEAEADDNEFEGATPNGSIKYLTDGRSVAGFRLAFPEGFDPAEKRAAMVQWLDDLKR